MAKNAGHVAPAPGVPLAFPCRPASPSCPTGGQAPHRQAADRQAPDREAPQAPHGQAAPPASSPRTSSPPASCPPASCPRTSSQLPTAKLGKLPTGKLPTGKSRPASATCCRQARPAQGAGPAEAAGKGLPKCRLLQGAAGDQPEARQGQGLQAAERHAPVASPTRTAIIINGRQACANVQKFAGVAGGFLTSSVSRPRRRSPWRELAQALKLPRATFASVNGAKRGAARPETACCAYSNKGYAICVTGQPGLHAAAARASLSQLQVQ